MRLNKLLVPLAFLMLFNSGAAVSGELSDVSTEPTDCIEMTNGLNHWEVVGVQIKLCSGTTNAKETVTCFVKAWSERADGGFDFNVSDAVNLCKTNAEPFSE